MHIANPIYDSVFKYLLDDNRVAKKLLSAIIGEDIAELKMEPTEYHYDKDVPALTVYRVDFSAKIRLGNKKGYKRVLIEIQKAKFPTDIMRFRKYLGIHYADKNNTYQDENGRTKATPIITIYFIGHRLEHIREPVIAVKRGYYSRLTGKRIDIQEKEDFIESLTHDSFIIQIPELHRKRRDELLNILSIFDQSRCLEKNPHIIDIDETHYPEKYKEVIRRLVRAVSTPKIVRSMDVEDDIIEELEDRERFIEKLKEERERVREEIEKAEEEKRKALEDRQKIEEEKRRIEADKRRAEEEKQRIETERQRAEEEKQRIEAARQRAEEEKQRIEAARQRAEEEKRRIEAARQKAEEEKHKIELEREKAEEEKRILREKLEKLQKKLKRKNSK